MRHSYNLGVNQLDYASGHREYPQGGRCGQSQENQILRCDDYRLSSGFVANNQLTSKLAAILIEDVGKETFKPGATRTMLCLTCDGAVSNNTSGGNIYVPLKTILIVTH